jgi:hypothetical protein
MERLLSSPLEADPVKVEHIGDKDLLQHIVLALILFGEVIPLRREARRPYASGLGEKHNAA